MIKGTKGQALRPENFIASLPSISRVKTEGISDEEKHLYALSNHAGWKVLSEYIDNLLEELDNKNAEAMNSGATFDMIGQNTIIITTVKGIIKSMQNKIQDAKESCENADGTIK